MPHVTPVSADDAPQRSQQLLEVIEKKYGTVPHIFGTMALQPDVLEGVTSITDGIQSDLRGSLRELAYLACSLANDCRYCSHYHTAAAKKAGVTEDQIAAIDEFQSSDHFDETEKAVLRYAVELTKTATVSPDTVAALKRSLSETELVTLAATVALANFTNRFNHGLDIELP